MREERKQTLAADLDRFNKAMKDVGESDSEWEEGVTTKASKNNKRRKTAANDVSISSNDDDESEEEDDSAVPSKLSEKQIFAAEDDDDDEATVTIEEMDEGNSQFAFAEKTVEQLKAPLKKKKSSTSLEDSIFKSQNSEDEEGYGVKTEDYIDFTKNKAGEAKQKKKKFRYLTKTERKQKVSKEKGRSKEKRNRAKK